MVLLATVWVVVGVGVTPVFGQSSDDPPDPSATNPTPAPVTQGDVSAQQTPPTVPTLYFSRDDNSELYVLDVNTAAATLVGQTGVTSDTVGLSESPDPGQLYGSTWEDLSVINADGSGFATAGTDDLDAEGLAYDPVNNILYKILNTNFATADQTTGATIDDLADPPADSEGLAWRGTNGKVYAWGNGTNDDLYVYTPGTDSWALVGSSDVPTSDSAGLAWDSINDVFYGIAGDGNLYRIDPDTAAATLIGDTGLDSGGGLAFLAPEAEAPTIIVAFTG